MARLKERAAKEEKRRRRAREDFTALLKDTRDIRPDTAWDAAQPLLEKHPEYKAVSGRSPRLAMTARCKPLASHL